MDMLLTVPTRAEILKAYQVIQFLIQPHMCLTSDAAHLIHVARLLAEYALNQEETQ